IPVTTVGELSNILKKHKFIKKGRYADYEAFWEVARELLEVEDVWKMTKGSFLLSKYAADMKPREAREYHREQVEKAFKEGKPIPEEVLKDYPELVEKVEEAIKEIEEEKAEIEKQIEEHEKAREYEIKEVLDSFISLHEKMDYPEEFLTHIEEGFFFNC
ncbi:unnamed protein product, partial [marine sediment metagenome]